MANHCERASSPFRIKCRRSRLIENTETQKSEIGHSLTNGAGWEINTVQVAIIQESLQENIIAPVWTGFPIRWSVCQSREAGAGPGMGMGREGVLGHGAPRGKTIGLGRTCAATVKLSGFYLSEGLPRWSEERNYFQLIKATYAKTIKVLIGHLFIKMGGCKKEENFCMPTGFKMNRKISLKPGVRRRSEMSWIKH